MKTVTKNSNLKEIIEKHPKVIPILLGYGLHCVNCSFSTFDTLESGAKFHGFSEEELGMMLKDLNAVINIELDEKNKIKNGR